MVLVATYAALSLFLLVVGEHLPVSWLRGAGALLFDPFDRLVLTGDRMYAAWRENTALHERIVRLELDNAQLRMQSAENQQLRRQLALPEWHGLALHAVEVLALAGDPLPTAATLSAGRRDGVQPGDALLTRDGLAGRVTESWGRLSRAALLTDPNLAVACEVESTGVNGILHFTLAPYPRLLLTAVPLADTLRVGERIVTSNLSLRFPRGIPVGRVRRIQREAAGLMQEVEVEPAAHLSRLRQAFVAPGPLPPDDPQALRPHLEFEPNRIAPPPPSRVAKPAARAHRDSLAAHARADSVARTRPAR